MWKVWKECAVKKDMHWPNIIASKIESLMLTKYIACCTLSSIQIQGNLPLVNIANEPSPASSIQIRRNLALHRVSQMTLFKISETLHYVEHSQSTKPCTVSSIKSNEPFNSFRIQIQRNLALRRAFQFNENLHVIQIQRSASQMSPTLYSNSTKPCIIQIA